MTRVAEYLRRNETIDGKTLRKLYDGEQVPDRTAPSESELRGANVDITLEADKEEVLAAEKQEDLPLTTEKQEEIPPVAEEHTSEEVSEEDAQK